MIEKYILSVVLVWVWMEIDFIALLTRPGKISRAILRALKRLKKEEDPMAS